ncbi:MAG: cob(I)yrinic acid a,c-diamide adenosyltransferase, partial [Lachnospiraceae bacterium]|nr:cob(I)yrinic acid a,c-diamide adenosyltransferase [Lachnospiraceae bacterium]
EEAKIRTKKVFEEVKDWYKTIQLQRQNQMADISAMIVLDEVMAGISTGFLEENEVINFIKSLPKEIEVVLTGRNPSKHMEELADYISVLEERKHPFQKGVSARKGVEY